jgi:hypothetical protein
MSKRSLSQHFTYAIFLRLQHKQEQGQIFIGKSHIRQPTFENFSSDCLREKCGLLIGICHPLFPHHLQSCRGSTPGVHRANCFLARLAPPCNSLWFPIVLAPHRSQAWAFSERLLKDSSPERPNLNFSITHNRTPDCYRRYLSGTRDHGTFVEGPQTQIAQAYGNNLPLTGRTSILSLLKLGSWNDPLAASG